MAKIIDIRKVVAANIEYFCRLNDMNMSDAAKAAGMAKATMSHKLNGSAEFKLCELQFLARKFKCSVADLVTSKGEQQ